MISGISAALVTPLDRNGRLDQESLERIVERILAAGVTGVSPAGSTGEGPRLTRKMRLALSGEVRKLVPASVAVLPNVPCNNVEDCLIEIQQLASIGCTAVLVAPPPYYLLDSEDVQRFYEMIADAAVLPVLLYNIPVFTKIEIIPEVVRILASHPGIAGIKDSSRSPEYFVQILAASGVGFDVLTGIDESLLDSFAVGADGAILASVNLAPELATGIFRSFSDGNSDNAFELQTRLTQLVRACRRGTFPAGWKAALDLAGLCQRWLADPAAPLAAPDRDDVAAALAKVGIAS